MSVLQGKPISPGYAEGTAVFYQTTDGHSVPRYAVEPTDVPGERDRFRQALECCWRELEDLEQRVLRELGHAQGAIFSAHVAMLKDRHFASKVEERIGRDLVNVEHVATRALRASAVDTVRELIGSLIRDVGAGQGDSQA